MQKNCEQCGVGFEILEGEKELLGRIFGKFDLPVFSLCPDCRQQKRLAFRNEKTLYKRKCDLCSKNVVTIYSEDSPYKVYCQDCFWGDKWDSKDFGRDFDFERPFFEQFDELMKAVPRLAVVNKQSENSEYCNYSFANKNCYLTFGDHYEEDCMYGRYATKNQDCVDYFWLYESELCYECIFSKNCYRSAHLDHCDDCSDCWFGFDMKGCKDCLFSHGLRNKQYFIFNEKRSKEEYEEYFGRLVMSSYKQWKNLKDGWDRYKCGKAIFKANYQTNCIDCEGNNLQNSKNLKHCFSCSGCEDCMYGFQMDETLSSVDNSHMGYDKSELCYNDIGCSGLFHCLNCDSCWHGSDLFYSNLCFSAKNCFGCIGMRQDEYCILNKQYTKEEYEKLLSRIVEHMQSSGEWGEFFPYSISPFAYNETVAQEYFPLKKEEVLKKGWKWKDEELKSSKDVDYEIPNDINDVGTDICDKILVCKKTSRPYKVVPKELEFYRKMQIPVPRFSPDQRQQDRLDLANPWKLWERKCDKCGVSIKTSYSPARGEKVYCEECYLKEVY